MDRRLIATLVLSSLALTSVCLGRVALHDDTAASTSPVRKTWTAVVNGVDVPAPDMAMGDDATLARIIDEGVNRNKVMEHLRYITQEIGPRLTGSERALRANEWLRDQYVLFGLSNPHLEPWGEISLGFTRMPSPGRIVTTERSRERLSPSQRAAATANRPASGGAATPAGAAPAADAPASPAAPAAPAETWRTARELQFTTLAWTRGTDGPVRGPVYRMPLDEEDWNDLKDKLKGAWILVPASNGGGVVDPRAGVSAQYESRTAARKKLADGAKFEELKLAERVACSPVAGYISSSKDERVWTGGARGWRTMTMETLPPEVHVTVRMSDYDYINSRIFDGDPVFAEFDLKHNFKPGPVPVFNTIAEIPGTEKPEEIVIISAHADSWDGPGSQGATDNGTGTVVTLEAARILMAAKAKPKRTIRFVHWTGEEQGLLGSGGYVKAHEAEMEKISAVFVDDGGTNYEGGLSCIESMRDMLAAATAPVNGLFFDSVDGKPLNVNIRVRERFTQSGGSDHMSFVDAKVPGFFWDESGRADYGYGWHTQNDKMELGVSEYLKQSSTCAAITAYRLACADTMLTRPTADQWPQRRQRPTAGGTNRGAASPASPENPASPTTPATPADPEKKPAPAPAPN